MIVWVFNEKKYHFYIKNSNWPKISKNIKCYYLKQQLYESP